MVDAIAPVGPQGQAKRRPEKLHALTSLRFFAALYVIAFHTLMIGRFPDLVPEGSFLGHFLMLGSFSVSFFFLLSGYILTMVYMPGSRAIRTGAFYRARFARIYPLYFLTLVADTPNLLIPRIADYGLMSGLAKTAVTFAGNALLIQAWFLKLRGINNPNWSLSVEAFFYLIFPLIGVGLSKVRGVAFWGAAAALYFGGQAIVLLAAPHLDKTTAGILVPFHLETFALGILLASWQMHSRRNGTAPRTNYWLVYAIAGLAAAAFLAVVNFYTSIPYIPLRGEMLAPVFCCLIWAFSHADWPPARLLSAPWLVVLGEASFGLYLIHMPVLHVFEHAGWSRIPLLYPVYLVLCIALSVLSFYYFEAPMRKWILKRGQGHVKETMEMASDAQ